MITPVLFILFPLAVGVALMPLARKPKASVAIVCVASMLLAALALFMPDDLVIQFAGRRFVFSETLSVLGRQLTVGPEDLTLVAWLFVLNTLWNLPSRSFKISMWFNALSLILTSLWIAVLAVEPFLYAALIIEIIALLSVPLLSPRGARAGPGLLRYLIFETLGMSMILLSGLMLSGIETAPSASPLILRASMLIVFGLAIAMAIFPLHMWIPMLGKESHPWVYTFLLGMSQTILVVFLLVFLDRYAWLRGLPGMFQSLSLTGVIMIAVGGVFAAFQKDLRRVFGYVFLAETGYAVLAVGLSQKGGLNDLALLMMPRALGYWLWGYALSNLQEKGQGNLVEWPALAGEYLRNPWISAALVFSLLSLSGTPLLASFPGKRLLWFLTPTQGLSLLVGFAMGVGGMVVFILRLIRVLIQVPDEETYADKGPESVGTRVLLIAMMALMALLGTFPFLVLPYFSQIFSQFTQLLPLP